MRWTGAALSGLLLAGCPADPESSVTSSGAESTGSEAAATTSTQSNGTTGTTRSGSTTDDATGSSGSSTGEPDAPPFACEVLWETPVEEQVEAAGAWDGFAQGYDFARGPDDAVWMLGTREHDAGGVYLVELGEDGAVVDEIEIDNLPPDAEGRELEIAGGDAFWIAGGIRAAPGAWIVRLDPAGSADLLDVAFPADFVLAGLALDDGRPVVVGEHPDGITLLRLDDDGNVDGTTTVPGAFAGGVAIADGDALVPSIDVSEDGSTAQGRLTRVAPDGAEVWTTPITIDAPFIGAATPTGVDLLPDGAVVVAFTTLYGHPAWQFWVARVDADGTLVWVRGSYDLAGKQTATLLSNAIAVTDVGEILVAGTRYAGGVLGAWLLALDENGDEICTHRFPDDPPTISRRVFWLDRAYVAAQAWSDTTQWSHVAALR